MVLRHFNREFYRKGAVILFFAILGFVYFSKSNTQFGWTKQEISKTTPITSDGAWYYAYLPGWFLYKTSKPDFYHKIEHKYSDYNYGVSGKFNKYYTGTALCLAPFFGIGHLHALLVGADLDGYSWPYLFWTSIGVICFAWFGFLGLYLVLQRLRVNTFANLLTLSGLAYATSVEFYVVFELTFAHIFSFCVINWTLFLVLKWNANPRIQYIWIVAFLVGFACIIRPTNILALVFVFALIWNERKRFWMQVKSVRTLSLIIVLFILPIFFQMFTVYAQTRLIALNSYTEEGFTNWGNPFFWEILFSFKKGLFIYAPFLILMLLGIPVLFRKNKAMGWGFSVFFIISTYILASWWCWWYGGSLGMRAMIDFFGIYAIPIAFLIHFSAKWIQYALTCFTIVSGYVYQVYTYQYNHHILHYSEMDFQKFKKVFLKKDFRFEWMYFMTPDQIPSNSKPVSPFYQINIEKDSAYHHPDEELSTRKIFGIPAVSGQISIRGKGKIAILDAEANPVFIVSYYKQGKVVEEKSVYLGYIPAELNHFEPFTFDIVSSKKYTEIDSVNCSLFYKINQIELSQFGIQFYGIK